MYFLDFFRKRTNKSEDQKAAARVIASQTRGKVPGQREFTAVSSGRVMIDSTRTDLVGTRTGDLRLALETGDMVGVRKFLDLGIDPNTRMAGGWTPLHWAADVGRADIVELLVARGAAVGTRQDEGMTPIHMAAKGGHDEAVRMLVSNGADIQSRNSVGSNALHYAVINQQSGTVATLLKCHADVNAADYDGITALHLASRSGWLDMVKTLVANGADVNAGQGTGLGTPLSITEDVAVAQFLKSQGAV